MPPFPLHDAGHKYARRGQPFSCLFSALVPFHCCRCPPGFPGSTHALMSPARHLAHLAPTPQELRDLVKRFLVRATSRRLGCMPGGTAEVKQHPWFRWARWLAGGGHQAAAPGLPAVLGPCRLRATQGECHGSSSRVDTCRRDLVAAYKSHRVCAAGRQILSPNLQLCLLLPACRGFDWDALAQRRLKAPYIPKVGRGQGRLTAWGGGGAFGGGR